MEVKKGKNRKARIKTQVGGRSGGLSGWLWWGGERESSWRRGMLDGKGMMEENGN